MNTSPKEISDLCMQIFDDENIINMTENDAARYQSFQVMQKCFLKDFRENIRLHGKKWAREESDEFNKKNIGRMLRTEEKKALFRNIIEYKDYKELKDIREEFQIKLFKSLSIGPLCFEVSPEAFDLLDPERLLINDYGIFPSHPVMRSGDLLIDLNDSSISKKIKSYKRRNKRIANIILKGDKCFYQTTDTDAMVGDLTRLELATQDDIKSIFDGLVQIL